MSIETPAGIHIGTWEVGSEEWLAARRNGLGGSEIAAVLGLSPFESHYSLWCRKKGLIGEVEVTPSMVWGNYAEPALLAWFNDKREPIDAKPGTFTNRDRPWVIANPDGLAADRIVEAKTAMDRTGWGKPGTDHIPPYYRCQGSWYALALGIDRCDVVASVQGAPPEVWTVLYDEDDAAYLLDKARDFMDSLDTGAEPEIDGHEKTYQAVRELNPDIEAGAAWYLDDETAETFQRAVRDEKTAKAAKRQAAARILRAMGNAQYAVFGKKRIASRQVKEGGAPFLVAARDAA